MSAIRAVLFDLDGTVYTDGVPFPGAAETVAELRRRGNEVGFVTNTTSRSRRLLCERLHAIGIDTPPTRIVTALLAGAAYLRERGIRRIAPLVPERALEDLGDFEKDQARPEAVVVGDLDDRWTYEILNTAFRQLMNGADLIALSRDRYWQQEDGLVLDCGPFVAALEYATGKTAAVCGKPSPGFFKEALASLGAGWPERAAEVLMVGDDIWGDIEGAQHAELLTCLVRTGKFREDVFQRSGVTPDMILNNLAELPEALG